MGFDNPLHIAFLLFVVLVVFGAKRLPEMGRSLGSGMRGFRDALTGTETESSLDAHETTVLSEAAGVTPSVPVLAGVASSLPVLAAAPDAPAAAAPPVVA
jgi:sec-independent protein translocase protein TatA